MTRFVLDPGAVLELVTTDLQVLPQHQLVAPGRVRSDVLELLFDAVRRARLTEQTAVGRLERLTS